MLACPHPIWRYTVALRHPQMPQASAAAKASAAANKFAPLRLLRIFGCAMLAAYTVAPRQSTPRCLTVFYLEIYGCLAAPAVARSHCNCKQVCSAQARIFGCALLAAYTVAPRHSTPRCLTAFYLEIYGCLAAPAVARSHCYCKQVCTALISSYIRLRNACRIYCSASAEQSRLPDCILFGDIRLPYGTRSCEKPLQLQTSLHCAVFFVYSAALCLPHILLRLGRAVSVALRHPQLREAIAIANKFAPLRLLTSVTSFFISPNRGDANFLLYSRLLRIFESRRKDSDYGRKGGK